VLFVDRDSPYHCSTIDDIGLSRDLLAHGAIGRHEGNLEACIVATRGYIYNCAFCGPATSRNMNIGTRRRSTVSLKSEINNLSEEHPGLKSIRLIDDLFLRDGPSIEAAISLFSDYPKLVWRAMTHINTFKNIPSEMLVGLRQSGCDELFIGIESGSPRILKKIHKIADIKMIVNVIESLFSVGINIKGYFMYGFPDETNDDFEMTYRLAVELRKKSLQHRVRFRSSVFRFRPYEGTELFESLEKGSAQLVHDWELTSRIGSRSHFNFKSDGQPKDSDKMIDDYIVKTLALNKGR